MELIAPQQSTVILTEILQKHFSTDSDCVDYFISMVASYQEAGSPFLKQQILSIFANQYSKETLPNAIPGLRRNETPPLFDVLSFEINNEKYFFIYRYCLYYF